MAIPKNWERHFIACALCGERTIQFSISEANKWMHRHAQGRHRKSSSYLPDAIRSVTVLFEANGSEDQQFEHVDPTQQMLATLNWINEEL